MKRRSATRVRLPRIEVPEGDAERFSLIVSDEPAARSEPGRDPKVTLNFSARGDLVRIDIADSPLDTYQIPEPIEENVYMSLTNAAERIGVHPATLRRAAARGTLRTRKFGTDWTTTPAWLEEYKRTRRSPGRPRKSA